MRYDYECPACRRVDEVVLKLCELDNPVWCPTCQSHVPQQMERLVSPPGMVKLDPYHMKAVTVDGAKIEGAFGKSYTKRGRTV